jgi:hypothetical protein
VSSVNLVTDRSSKNRVYRVGFCAAVLVTFLASLASGSERSQLVRETSVTLAQIVARQIGNYQRIRTARGQVVWREEIYTTPTTAPPLRVIQFAFDTTGSVNLVLAWDGKSRLPRQKEKPDWSRVLAAFLVEGENVYQIRPPTKDQIPSISWTPFNPDVHGRNPLVRFHPALLGDETIALADLARVQEQMRARISIAEIGSRADPRIRVSFTNPERPNELLYYLINPQKGWLPEFIGRYSGNRCLFQTSILIGKTANGVWIPSRRTKLEYNSNGEVSRREEWYYLDLSVNERLPAQQISFAYFHLPPEAFPQRVQTNAPSSEMKSSPSTQRALPRATAAARQNSGITGRGRPPGAPQKQQGVPPEAAPLPTPKSR